MELSLEQRLCEAFLLINQINFTGLSNNNIVLMLKLLRSISKPSFIFLNNSLIIIQRVFKFSSGANLKNRCCQRICVSLVLEQSISPQFEQTTPCFPSSVSAEWYYSICPICLEDYDSYMADWFLLVNLFVTYPVK